MAEDDLMSLIDAERSRLKALLRRADRERDAARAEIERLTAHAELLQFCLDQARIVLSHFADNLPDLENRTLAFGALVASDRDDPGRMAEAARKALRG